MKALLFVAALLWLHPAASGATAFLTPIPGVEVTQGSIQHGGRSVKYTLMRCDPKRVGIRVADTLHELGRGSNLNAFSLRVLSRSGSLVAVNAGSTESYSVPVPSGLLMVGGRIISPANGQALDSGVVCISGTRVSILRIGELDTHDCVYAVQRGPVLLPGGRPVADQSHRRTVAGVDTSGRLLLLVTADRIALAGVYDFLSSSGDLNIVSAMNMDGDASSGLIASPQIGLTPSEIGNIDALVASAIVIYQNPR